MSVLYISVYMKGHINVRVVEPHFMWKHTDAHEITVELCHIMEKLQNRSQMAVYIHHVESWQFIKMYIKVVYALSITILHNVTYI